MKINKNPFVSFVIPTYNADKYLNNCLESVRKQIYPKDKYEILIVDGGSRDETLKITKRFNIRVFRNPQRDTESGKAIGISRVRGKIIALIDAENELIQKSWFREMVRPFLEDKSIFGVESPWTVKDDDSSLNQYFALLRISDPLARIFHPKTKSSRKKKLSNI